ncbi:hypothetical protein K443DRAFT_111705, partial [Laccaria amethystina LaAM-08-1]
RTVGGDAVRNAEEGLREENRMTDGLADRRRSLYVRANHPSHRSRQLRCLRRGSSFEPWMPKLQRLTC